jgi:ribosomal protein S12 methylthiotransferase
VKRERLERLLEVQRSITQARNEESLGRQVTVLVDALTGRDMEADGPDVPRGAVGRTARQALEIDGVVHIEEAGDALPGDFVRVAITDVVENDLRGEGLGDARDTGGR